MVSIRFLKPPVDYRVSVIIFALASQFHVSLHWLTRVLHSVLIVSLSRRKALDGTTSIIEIFANLCLQLYSPGAGDGKRGRDAALLLISLGLCGSLLRLGSRPLMIIVNCDSFLQHNLMDFLWSLNTLEEWQIGIVKPVNFLPSQAIFIGSQNQNDHFIFLMYLPSS